MRVKKAFPCGKIYIEGIAEKLNLVTFCNELGKKLQSAAPKRKLYKGGDLSRKLTDPRRDLALLYTVFKWLKR